MGAATALRLCRVADMPACAAGQPIRTDTGELYATELLVRRPGAAPGEGAAAELSHLITPGDWLKFDVFMLRSAVSFALVHPSAFVFVNLSPATASDPRLLHHYLDMLEMATAALPVASIVVEVNEKLAASLADINTLIALLHERRVAVAMDDFHGSTECWRKSRANWDCIKLDARRLGSEPMLMALRDFTKRPAAERPATLIAEAVESESLCAAAFEAGAHAVQGFAVGRPELIGRQQ